MRMRSVITFTIIFSVVFFGLFGGIPYTHANPEYVDECLENPESCEEPLEEDDRNETAELLEQEEPSSLFFQIVRLVFALLLVLGLIYVFLYFLKRRNKLSNGIENLENIGGISVGPNKTVQLIRLGNKLYLIGVAENITLLKELEDPTLVEEMLRAKEGRQSELGASDILSSILKRNQKKKMGEDQFSNLFSQELDRLKETQKSIIERNKEDRNE